MCFIAGSSRNRRFLTDMSPTSGSAFAEHEHFSWYSLAGVVNSGPPSWALAPLYAFPSSQRVKSIHGVNVCAGRRAGGSLSERDLTRKFWSLQVKGRILESFCSINRRCLSLIFPKYIRVTGCSNYRDNILY